MLNVIKVANYKYIYIGININNNISYTIISAISRVHNVGKLVSYIIRPRPMYYVSIILSTMGH